MSGDIAWIIIYICILVVCIVATWFIAIAYRKNISEDKKKKEEIEARNNAESLVYNCQKTVDELGDKISGEEKAKAETEISNVKKALEGSDVEAIKAATEKLTTVFYSISEKLYSQTAGAKAGADANGANVGEAEGPKTDENGNVYNAEYKVDEDDKKDEKK